MIAVHIAPGKPSRRERLHGWWLRKRHRWPKGYREVGFIKEIRDVYDQLDNEAPKHS